MNNMKVKIEEDILNYMTKIQCLNIDCVNNLEGIFCNLKNIIINKNSNCFNFDNKKNDSEERLER